MKIDFEILKARVDIATGLMKTREALSKATLKCSLENLSSLGCYNAHIASDFCERVKRGIEHAVSEIDAELNRLMEFEEVANGSQSPEPVPESEPVQRSSIDGSAAA